MEDRAGQERLNRRTRDRAAVLLALGILMFLPPFVGILSIETRIASVPLPLVYLFTVWAALIWATRRLSGQLAEEQEDRGTQGETGAER